MVKTWHILAVLMLASTSVSVTGCGKKQIWNAQTVVTPTLRIQPLEVSVAKSLLYVQTSFVNTGPVPITIDRDRVTVTLPDGRTITRSQGTTTQHTPYFVAPNAEQKVYVDFKAEGFAWKDVADAQVNWTGAVMIDGRPIDVPPTHVSPNPYNAAPAYTPPPPAYTAAPTYTAPGANTAPPAPTYAPPNGPQNGPRPTGTDGRKH
jgi:hypothetical protein